MKKTLPFTNLQMAGLLILRFLVGWHVLYEGIAKLQNPAWSSRGFLNESQWILSGVADWIVSHPGVLNAVDFLNSWGLIAIGLGVILGLFFRTAAITGAILLLIYYLNAPPLAGLDYALPRDGNNLIVDKTLIEAAALALLSLFPTSGTFGLDRFFQTSKKRKD